MECFCLRKNYFDKIIKYTKNVFNIETSLNKLWDKRNNPKHTTAQVILPVLIGFLLRTRSFNNLNNMLHENEFVNIVAKGVKLPKIDAIRDTLKVIEIAGLRGMLKYQIKKARETKVFDTGTIDGYTVAGIDGTQPFNKFNRGSDLFNLYSIKLYATVLSSKD